MRDKERYFLLDCIYYLVLLPFRILYVWLCVISLQISCDLLGHHYCAVIEINFKDTRHSRKQGPCPWETALMLFTNLGNLICSALPM